MHLPSSIAAAITLFFPTSPYALADITAPAPLPQSLLTTASKLAASLKVSYPNQSVALLVQPFWWWQSGSAIDALLSYAQTTGDSQYNSLVQNTILGQATGTKDFMTVDATGNDDQAWWALAALTAAENNLPSPGVPWLTLAQNVFNEQKARWDTTKCNGGMKWKILEGDGTDGYHYKSSIANGLFFQLAARLAHITKDADTLAWAEKAYDWVVGVGLIDGNYNVYDGTDDAKGANGCVDVNHSQWSYNTGVFLHGAAVMASQTGEAKWSDRTIGFIAAAKRNFVNAKTGALFELNCDGDNSCNTDQVSFKGTLARWLGATAALMPNLKANVATITNGAATAVLNGKTTGLGPIASFNAMEILDAGLRTQGVEMGQVIGLVKGAPKAKRSIAGRISW
ncbi:glycoside hydrolase family 76 protein [Pleomassaria siparia CBS 279.74]|uniref:mannan endo-1,6-alpha-mannosidase n=1 Tax=Pleomassaria siparia CBS 279.74 TaxID=1314801 RepID=A0A6G1JSY0_9PLEO|nr:glycoside hydrolase family 76 protein [Pleomassaria siparia CBS 279.74]